ncbi:hypothetical protein BC629DRAFT_1434430 [Irpex lacteus]|nr:hypothetical protein BC629DRAFT_1434430 [Irpex lacteus]
MSGPLLSVCQVMSAVQGPSPRRWTQCDSNRPGSWPHRIFKVPGQTFDDYLADPSCTPKNLCSATYMTGVVGEMVRYILVWCLGHTQQITWTHNNTMYCLHGIGQQGINCRSTNIVYHRGWLKSEFARFGSAESLLSEFACASGTYVSTNVNILGTCATSQHWACPGLRSSIRGKAILFTPEAEAAIGPKYRKKKRCLTERMGCLAPPGFSLRILRFPR